MGIVGVEGRTKRPNGLEVRTGEGGASISVEGESAGFSRGLAGGCGLARTAGLSSVDVVEVEDTAGTLVVAVAGKRKGFNLMYPSSICVARFSSQGFKTEPSWKNHIPRRT